MGCCTGAQDAVACRVLQRLSNCQSRQLLSALSTYLTMVHPLEHLSTYLLPFTPLYLKAAAAPLLRREMMGGSVSYDVLNSEAAKVPPGSEGLLALDHFQVRAGVAGGVAAACRIE